MPRVRGARPGIIALSANCGSAGQDGAPRMVYDARECRGSLPAFLDMRERATAATLVVDLDALAERGRAALAAQAATADAGEPDLAGQALAMVRAQGEAAQRADAAEEHP